VIGYPTETVYGLGSAVSAGGAASLRALKPRSGDKPFVLLIDGLDMLDALGATLSRDSARLAAAFWPGPLTLLLRGAPMLDQAFRGQTGEIAVRWTSHAGAARLIRAFGAPISSTSANLAGLPPARSAQEIVHQWPREVSRGALVVLDGGSTADEAPSTIVDCAGGRLRVVRAGAIAISRVRAAVPDLAGEG
jgi:L-threonylcarbamoyladenylate synthase